MPRMASDPRAETTHADKSYPYACCATRSPASKKIPFQHSLAAAHGASYIGEILHCCTCIGSSRTSALSLRRYTPRLVCHFCATLFSCQRIHSHDVASANSKCRKWSDNVNSEGDWASAACLYHSRVCIHLPCTS